MVAMKCPVPRLVRRLLDGTIAEEEIMEAEILIRDRCAQLNLCETTLNHFAVRTSQERMDSDDPSKTEEDRRRRKR